MKKRIVRWLSLLLCFSTVIGPLPTLAFAEQEPTVVVEEVLPTEETESIEVAEETSLTEEAESIEAETKAATRATITETYLDIPIEVYDFRADGFLFESMNTFDSPYSLSEGSPTYTLDDGTQIERPGTREEAENYASSALAFWIDGLIEDDLYYDENRGESRIVYKPEVIEYVAVALMNDTKYVPYASHFSAGWNNIFLEKLQKKDSKGAQIMQLGSWDDTLGKIEGGVNGVRCCLPML